MKDNNREIKPGLVARILWWVAGAEYETLLECRHDKIKFEVIGGMILMTCLMGFFSGGSAAWYFSQSWVPTLIFGAFWALMIFTIDRALVVTLKKVPGKRNNYVLQLISRAALAFLVALVMSIPLELIVFNDFIQQNLEQFKQEQLTQLHEAGYDSAQARELGTQISDINSGIDRIEADIRSKDSELERLNREVAENRARLNHPTTDTYKKAYALKSSLLRQQQEVSKQQEPSAILLSSLAWQIKRQDDVMRSETSQWNSRIRANLTELEAKAVKLKTEREQSVANRQARQESRDKLSLLQAGHLEESSEAASRTRQRLDKSNNFILYFRVLEHAMNQKRKVEHPVPGSTDGKTYTTMEYSNPDEIMLLWLIRVFFFIVEMLPTVVKIAAKTGEYEYRVYNAEKEAMAYYSSQEFHDAQQQLLNAPAKEEALLLNIRLDAERKLQESLIEQIKAAQEEVARKCIEKWKNEELSKI